MRADDLAAVADRRVGGRELQRRRLQVALPDREVHVVADAPSAVGLVAAVDAVEDLLAPAGVRAGGLLEELVAPLRRRQQAGSLARDVDAGQRSEAELLGPVLDDLLSGLVVDVVGHATDVVEEDVGGDPQRRDHVDDAVRGLAGVPPRVVAELERAGVVESVLGRDQPGLERRRPGDRLERRAGRVAGLDRPVEQRVLLVVGQVLDHVRLDRRREDARIEGRRGAHAEDRSVADVHRDERARQPAARERRFAGRLDLLVEGQLQVVAGLGLDPRELAAARLAGCIDLDADRAVAATEDRVVLRLEAGGADPIARLEPLVGRLLELVGADLGDVAEQLRPERPVRVVADVDLGGGDAGELVLALAQVVDEVLVDVLLERHRVGGKLLGLLADLLLDLVVGHVRDPGQLLELLVASLLVVRQLVGTDLQGQDRLVVDEDAAGAVEDLAARRLDLDLADAVGVRLLQVGLAGEDLEEPEAEEDRREGDDPDAAEDRHPHRELGVRRGGVFVVAEHQTLPCPLIIPNVPPRRPMLPARPGARERARPASSTRAGRTARRTSGKTGIARRIPRSPWTSTSRSARMLTGASTPSVSVSRP